MRTRATQQLVCKAQPSGKCFFAKGIALSKKSNIKTPYINVFGRLQRLTIAKAIELAPNFNIILK